MTVNDGDTVAIGGIITDKRLDSSGGVPLLHRIPIVGAAFGAKSNSSSRVELIIFLTPRVIYDTSQVVDATDELKRPATPAKAVLVTSVKVPLPLFRHNCVSGPEPSFAVVPAIPLTGIPVLRSSE